MSAGIKVHSFSDKDFESLYFPVHQLKGRDKVLVKFPVLQKFPEFELIRPLSLDKIFKYIVYMYDWNSPLRGQIDDFKVRKYNAMILAGYKLNDSALFDEEVNDVLMNKNEKVNLMIFRYARITMGERYSTLVSLQMGYQQSLTKVSMGSSSAYKDMELIRKNIDDITQQILSDDSINRVNEQFLDYVDMENLGIRPEDIAEAMERGVPILPGINPYNLKVRKYTMTQDPEKHRKQVMERYGADQT